MDGFRDEKLTKSFDEKLVVNIVTSYRQLIFPFLLFLFFLFIDIHKVGPVFVSSYILIYIFVIFREYPWSLY